MASRQSSSGRETPRSGSKIRVIAALLLPLACGAGLLFTPRASSPLQPGSEASSRRSFQSVMLREEAEGNDEAALPRHTTPSTRELPPEATSVIPMRETKASVRTVKQEGHDATFSPRGKTRTIANSRSEPAVMKEAATAVATESPALLLQETVARIPVVYQFSDGELLAHSPGVSSDVLDAIRNNFERDSGAGQLDPADPEYSRRWQLAAPSADERYRTLFGWQAFADLQRRAAADPAPAGP
jgi:hypothetical protein